MNDDGASIRVEERNRSRSERDAIRGERNPSDSACRNHDVGRVTGVRAGRVAQTMLLAERVVVPARRRECRGAAFAFCHLVKMNAMRPRWQSETRNFDVHQTVGVLPQVGGADWSPVDVVNDRGRSRNGVAHPRGGCAGSAESDGDDEGEREVSVEKSHFPLRLEVVIPDANDRES